jgi:hypothetical protein
MKSRALLFTAAVLFLTTASARAENFDAFYTIVGWGAIGSIVLGIASTAWTAIKSHRRWVWFLFPVFILAWAVVFSLGFMIYAAR